MGDRKSANFLIEEKFAAKLLPEKAGKFSVLSIIRSGVLLCQASGKVKQPVNGEADLNLMCASSIDSLATKARRLLRKPWINFSFGNKINSGLPCSEKNCDITCSHPRPHFTFPPKSLYKLPTSVCPSILICESERLYFSWSEIHESKKPQKHIFCLSHEWSGLHGVKSHAIQKFKHQTVVQLHQHRTK